LSHQTESTDQDRTLPLPELNPLINPLLGRHMGRWAEVYFTAAPEHREEAVLALLRELESGNAAKPAETLSKASPMRIQFADESVPAPGQSSARNPGRAPLGLERIEPLRKFAVCESCGQGVPETQRFCGMCGAPMRGESASFNDSHIDNNHEGNEESYPINAEEFQETTFSFGGNVGASDESAPYHYRIYVGAALIILIAALVLMAYRGTRDWAGTSHPLPQAAPSADSQPAAQPAAAQPAAKSDAPAPVADNNRAAAADGKVEPKQESRPSTPPPPPLDEPRNAQPPVSNLPSSAASQGSGLEELQVAERYLNGGHGNARDSREAARWLWQAVGKQNASASLLLSDLYMRGEGVPKNCDQARLLLDAAARKGAAGAGARLRNFQAFGCP
jgi:hypothetical protein